MRIIFGRERFNQDRAVIWHSSRVYNGHMLVLGASGTGKTHLLRKAVNQMVETSGDFVGIFVLDVHGDLEFSDSISSTVIFSESGRVGINPLKVSSDRQFGGVRKKIRSFVSAINRTSRKLGIKQENVLIHLLEDLYAANGFYIDDPQTWSLDYDPRKSRFSKKYPTMEDLKKFSEYKLKQMVTGAGSKAMKKLDELNRKFTLLEKYRKKLLKKGSLDETEISKIENKIEDLKEETKRLYSEYIDSIETGRELDDYIKYDSEDVLKSVLRYIESLYQSGIFKGKEPDFGDKPVRRYLINSLNPDEQKLFVDFLLEEIFFKAKEEGIKDRIDRIIVLDEAHMFFSDEPEHIVNIISKEGRKFGIALVMASQSLSHFSDDVLSNTATKIILGVDEVNHEKLSRKLRINKQSLRFIEPRKTALIQIKNHANLNNKYVNTVLTI